MAFLKQPDFWDHEKTAPLFLLNDEFFVEGGDYAALNDRCVGKALCASLNSPPPTVAPSQSVAKRQRDNKFHWQFLIHIIDSKDG